MSNNSTTIRGGQVRPELELRHILVPTDFSLGAQSALDCARSLARKFQSKVFLLHVIPTDAFQFVSPETPREALVSAREFADQQLQELIREGETRGIAHEGMIAEGPVWPMISESIKSKQIDLLAIGTHGRSRNKKLVLGSVAEEIYRMADCPLLTVPPEIGIPRGGNTELRHVLFATNFKPHNERASAIAHMIECGLTGHLTMLHVVEGPREKPSPSQKLVEDFMINRMRKGLPQHCSGECKPDFEVRFGKPVEEILSVAKQRNSDLILIGLRAVPRTVGHLPSAVAYSIVCQSSCPVLTLHQ